MITELRPLSEFCASLGKDFFLVQGAGGNVSFKCGDRMWVKASGTSLANATQKNIFVDVDWVRLREQMEAGNFELPTPPEGSVLRPSIETPLHALMPYTHVLHLHPVHIVACLVRSDSLRELERIMGGADICWALVPYETPGARLAEAVQAKLVLAPDVQAVFLQNHGVIIGADSLEDLQQLLDVLVTRFDSDADLDAFEHKEQADVVQLAGYSLETDPIISLVSSSPAFCDFAQNAWPICPDHVVFLGARCRSFKSMAEAQAMVDMGKVEENFFCVCGVGVFTRENFSDTQRQQLRFYCEVIARQERSRDLSLIDDNEVSQLLDWDAEKFRQRLAN